MGTRMPGGLFPLIADTKTGSSPADGQWLQREQSIRSMLMLPNENLELYSTQLEECRHTWKPENLAVRGTTSLKQWRALTSMLTSLDGYPALALWWAHIYFQTKPGFFQEAVLKLSQPLNQGCAKMSMFHSLECEEDCLNLKSFQNNKQLWELDKMRKLSI